MIHEDPDNLGYSMGDKPYDPWAGVSSLVRCNDVLPREQQDDIEDAAYYEDVGELEEAEACRAFAGYSEAHLRSDPR